MSGWIKIHRSILKNPWMQDISVLGAWVYILMNVAYQPEDVIFEGKRITLQPGQGLFKIRQMAKILGVSHSKLNRTILLFTNEKQIETQTSPRNTIITVLNWQKYQAVETQKETQMEHNRNTTETQVEHLPIIKELKNIRNKEIYKEKEIKEKEKPQKTEFDIFWDEYPRREGKGAARKSFEKAIKKTTLDVLLEAVRKQKQSDQWTKDNGQYIPHPATWLNQERWEDELDFNGGSNGANNNTGQNMDRKPTGIESRAAAFEAAIRAAQERRQAGTLGAVQTGGSVSEQDLRTTDPQGKLPL